MSILFVSGILLEVHTSLWSRQTIYHEHDKHLAELSSTVDHNIEVVLNRCRTELSGLVRGKYFQNNEKTFQQYGDSTGLVRSLKNCAVLLSDYADRILVFNGSEAVISTEEDENLAFHILTENGQEDVFLCVDNAHDKSYLAVSCPSETNENVYYVLINLEPFFRRVVADTIYEDHWIVLYDKSCGLTLQNDDDQPEYKIFSAEDILKRQDGYTRIYEYEQNAEMGVSEYSYKTESGIEEKTRIHVIPTAASENRVFAVAVAVYNENIAIPMKRMMFDSIFAAAMVAFSAAAAVFLLLHSRRKERELADELASLEKEKKLIDEIVKNQEQVAHHQQLETIGTLTAGIAHEFNNLLSPIMGNSMLILEKSRTTDPEIFDNALEVYDASDRAKELVLKILKLSRRQSANQMSPVLPDILITGVLAVSAASIPNNITVKKVINTDSYIFGDESQLSHMLLNLVLNAVQAMRPESGTLTVQADADGSNVYISVSDTGKGIPEEYIASVFDPFFTTKEVGKGTGLGLSIAQKTASNHGGTITAENLPEGGARFTFTVPIYEA